MRYTQDDLIIIEDDLLIHRGDRRPPPVWSVESACSARAFLWFQAVLSIYVSPLWISKSSSMIINISGVRAIRSDALHQVCGKSWEPWLFNLADI